MWCLRWWMRSYKAAAQASATNVKPVDDCTLRSFVHVAVVARIKSRIKCPDDKRSRLGGPQACPLAININSALQKTVDTQLVVGELRAACVGRRF